MKASLLVEEDDLLGKPCFLVDRSKRPIVSGGCDELVEAAREGVPHVGTGRGYSPFCEPCHGGGRPQTLSRHQARDRAGHRQRLLLRFPAPPRKFSPEDLAAIEKEMRRIISGGAAFTKREISKEEARRVFADQAFKLELIDGLEDGSISLYEQDGFVDLCRGPHVENVREIRPDAFKLYTIAGAYWRGDEKRPMLHSHLRLLLHQQGRARSLPKDARGGGEARLIAASARSSISSRPMRRRGPGLIYWHPKGGRFRVELENWLARGAL